jgi:hypothetical protein
MFSSMILFLPRLAEFWDTWRYGTGGDSDRAPMEKALPSAPGRYRSRYHVRQDNRKLFEMR